MAKVKTNAPDPANMLPLPDLYELAKPKPALAKPDKSNRYRWQIGHDVPELGRHSVAKHEIFERYVKVYIETLTKNHRKTHLNLTIVDGFCGGGRYRLDGEEVDGSPLRMLHAVEKAQDVLDEARARGFVIACDFVFVDADRDHIAFLRDQLEKRGYGPRLGRDIRLIHSTFEEAAPDIIAAIRKKGHAHRSLFFLDQFGWSGVRLQTVRDIMSQLKNPEVVLTFMVDAFINLLCERNSSLAALAAIDFTREDARALMAMKDREGWKRIIQNTIYKHIQTQTGARFYTPFFIHPPESHRDYWLLHLAKHHQAREEMGKVFWSTNNTMEHFGGPGVNALGFDPRQDMRDGMFPYHFDQVARERSSRTLLEQIPTLLHQAVRDQGSISKRELFEPLANETPVIADLLDATLAELRASKEIEIVGRRPGQDRDDAPLAIRERTRSFDWDDEIRFVRERSLFSVLGHSPPSR